MTAEAHDPFFWLGEINKASAVMAVEQAIVAPALGAKIAAAVARVIADGDKPGAKRSGNYLAIERDLVAAGGPEVTLLHSGRSRQDIVATMGRLAMREEVLGAFAALGTARGALLALAERHAHAIIPAYTWGVQAQPTTLGHYLLGYAAVFSRAAERLREGLGRVNRSPLGAAALGTSGFPVDRARLAELLGFDGVVENSFDAAQLSPIDCGAEMVGLAAAAALGIGTLIADITQQYAQSRPWLTLAEGELTGTSSIMPQKRNPSGLVFLRAQASTLLGHAHTFLVVAHNVAAGMSDYKPFIAPLHGDQPNNVMRELGDVCERLAGILRSLRFDEIRALAEVEADYSTTTGLADTLQQAGGVPLRVGHHFASELVNYGRANGLKPSELPYAHARRVYAETARHFGLSDATLPLDEAGFFQALSARHMIAASRGLGGPQPAEVARMLAREQAALADDHNWLTGRREALAKAARTRDDAFNKLHGG